MPDSIEIFIQEMTVLMASHCDNYETLFGWLDMMRSEDSNKGLVRKVSLMKASLDRLPNQTIPLFQQLAADATLDHQMQFANRMNYLMQEVSLAPREELLKRNLAVVHEMYRELEIQCIAALCIVRDVAELKFNYLQGDEDFPRTIEQLAERDGYCLGGLVQGEPGETANSLDTCTCSCL